MLKKKETSPVKAKLRDTLLDNREVFYFENPGKKRIGVSPDGKTKIALQKFEGASHNRIRARDNNTWIMSGNSPVKSPYKNSFEANMLKLDVKLFDLKSRVDSDYKMYHKKKNVEEDHYKFTQSAIKTCIKLLKKCYRLTKDKDLFIELFNNKMTTAALYNPFSLKKLYPRTGYEGELASENFNSELIKEDVCVKFIPLNLPSENSDNTKLQGTLKRKGFFDNNTQLLPRSVKMKKNVDGEVLIATLK